MFSKFIHFIKYNNLTVLIILAIFLISGGVFAQTPTGQEIIGAQEKKIEGIDNELLLAADLDNFKMDFKIEKIEEDIKYYYVTYTYLDLIPENGAWQYQMQEKVRKISKKLRQDLGVYIAGQLQKEYEARVRDLKIERTKAEKTGETKRTEVVAYTGLIGQTLDVVGKIIPGYEPVKKYEIPSPTIPPTILQLNLDNASNSDIDNLTQIYQDYIDNNNLDFSNIDTASDNTVTDASATTTEQNIIDDNAVPASAADPIEDDTIPSDTAGDDSTNLDDQTAEPTDVQIIELPAE